MSADGNVDTKAPGSAARVSNETFGMVLFLAAEVMFFSGLASTYTVLRLGAAQWKPAGLPSLVSPLSLSNTALLFVSAGSMFLAYRAIRREDPMGLRLHLVFAMLLGLTFVGIQVYECGRLMAIVPMAGNIFGSVFYTLVGLHGLHVLGGVVFLGYVLWNAFHSRYHRYRATGVKLASLYWYFVVVVWVFIYLALFVF